MKLRQIQVYQSDRTLIIGPQLAVNTVRQVCLLLGQPPPRLNIFHIITRIAAIPILCLHYLLICGNHLPDYILELRDGLRLNGLDEVRVLRECYYRLLNAHAIYVSGVLLCEQLHEISHCD